jgi:hypothetical protein
MADFFTPNPGSAFLSGDTATTDITNTSATAQPSNYLICQRSGFRVPVSEGLAKEWTGLQVRRQSFDTRHPQDLIRAKAEQQQRGSPAPEPQDRFLSTNEVTLASLG